MRILTLVLCNYGPHRFRKLDFSPRMNLILGPNGCGKSTVLNGILYGLTNIERAAGNKSSNVWQFAGKKDESFVEVLFEHRGKSYKVQRRLRPTGSDLWEVAGDDLVHLASGANEVTSKIVSLLGYSEWHFDRHAFIPQAKLTGWFDKTEAERTKELAVLFGLDRAEKIWQEAGEFLSTLGVPAPVDLEAHDQRIAYIQSQLTVAEQELQKVEDQPLSQEEADRLRQIVERRRERTDAEQKVAHLSDEITRTRAQILSEEELLAESKRLKAMEEELEKRRCDREYASKVITLWEALSHAARVKEKRDGLLETLSKMARRRPTYVCVSEARKGLETIPGLIDELVKQRERFCERLAAREQLLETGVCPVCLTEFSDISVDLETDRQQLKQLDVEISVLKTGIQASESILREHRNWLAFKEEFSRKLKEYRLLCEMKLETSELPAWDLDTAHRVVREFNDYQSRVNSERANYERLIAVRAERLEKLQVLNKRYEEALAAMNALPVVDADEARAAASRLHQAAILSNEYNRRQIRVTELRASLNMLIDERKVLMVRDLDYRATMRVRDTINKVRELTYRSGILSEFVKAGLQRLMDPVNRGLAVMESSFRVEQFDGMTFYLRFADGVLQPDHRLSVGQRVALAMAFRLAFASTGILALDEPTAFLDAHHLQTLPALLDRLRDVSDSNDLQVFFVTHDPRVSSSFDEVFHLGHNKQ